MFICNCKARLGYPRVPNICDSSITNSKSSALCTQAENDIELADVLTFVGSVTNLHYLITVVLTGRANRFGKFLLALCLLLFCSCVLLAFGLFVQEGPETSNRLLNHIFTLL